MTFGLGNRGENVASEAPSQRARAINLLRDVLISMSSASVPQSPAPPSHPPLRPPFLGCYLIDGPFTFQSGVSGTGTIYNEALTLNLGSLGTGVGTFVEVGESFQIVIGGGTPLDGTYDTPRTWSGDCTEADFTLGVYPVTLFGYPARLSPPPLPPPPPPATAHASPRPPPPASPSV